MSDAPSVLPETPPPDAPIPSGVWATFLHAAIAAAIFGTAYSAACGAVFAGWLTPESQSDATAHRAHLRLMAQRDPGELFTHIVTTNLKATAALLVVGVATAGLFAIAYTAIFAAHVAISSAPAVAAGVPTSVVAAFLVPHGVVEMPALWLAAGVGLRAGVLFCGYLASGHLPARAVSRQLAWGAAASLALVPVAAVVEAYVTPAVGAWMLGPG